MESSDCGLTCIQMVAHYFGLDVSLKYLRNISDLSRDDWNQPILLLARSAQSAGRGRVGACRRRSACRQRPVWPH
ncbi:MAG: cysteine peptidase family C39 domain-containing protein [Prevotella sp.]